MKAQMENYIYSYFWNAEQFRLYKRYFLPFRYTHLQIVTQFYTILTFNHAFYEHCVSRDFTELIYHRDFTWNSGENQRQNSFVKLPRELMKR